METGTPGQDPDDNRDGRTPAVPPRSEHTDRSPRLAPIFRRFNWTNPVPNLNARPSTRRVSSNRRSTAQLRNSRTNLSDLPSNDDMVFDLDDEETAVDNDDEDADSDADSDFHDLEAEEFDAYGSNFDLAHADADLHEIGAEHFEGYDDDGFDLAQWYPGPAADGDRDSFRHRINKIEIAQDIERLYPPSLDPHYRAPTSSIQTGDEPTAFTYMLRQINDGGVIELVLNAFAFYDRVQLHGKGVGGQLRTPVDAITKERELVIDGIIQKNDEKMRVEGMNITKIEIAGFNDPSLPTTDGQVFVYTKESERQNVKYRLAAPVDRYERTWKAFIWMADFSKFVIRFLDAATHERRRLTLHSFEQDFYDFITGYYDTGTDRLAIDHWLGSCDRITDFRKHVIRLAPFLKFNVEIWAKETDVDPSDHDLWDDLGMPWLRERNSAAQSQKGKGSVKAGLEKTVVTSDVGAAFLRAFPRWGTGPAPVQLDLLAIEHPNSAVRRKIDDRRKMLRFPNKYQGQNMQFSVVGGELVSRAASTLKAVAESKTLRTYQLDQVIGMLAIVQRGFQFQYAYVRDVAPGHIERVLVVWLVLPSETTCGKNFYPIGNDLFFSDECSCDSIRVKSIRGIYPVDLFAECSSSPDGFFVHGLYQSATQDHVTPIQAQVLSGCLKHTVKTPEATCTLPPPSTLNKLKVHGLFAGCGLLDHSMCSTGYFTPKFAIDLNKTALLSHKINTKAEANCRHVADSTNAHLRRVLHGSEEYPDADCLVAGCPCQGFSPLNQNKSSRESHRNCSMLANLLSYIATYLPRYGMIENVTLMDPKKMEEGAANACQVAISVLVSLGYQVSKKVVSGETMHAATRRQRLFIVFAAPGLKLPETPTPTGPPKTAIQVIQHLDPVDNDTLHNVVVPDHIPSIRLDVDFEAGIALRNVVSKVPARGKRRNLFAAYHSHKFNEAQNIWYEGLTKEKREKGSGSFRRLKPDGLFSTITCTIVPINSRSMRSIHPSEHRVLSLEELRRGQGLPEDFLLIGTKEQAISQVGNGVAWEVGEGWGLSFAKAAFESGVLVAKEGEGWEKWEEREEREERPQKRARHQ